MINQKYMTIDGMPVPLQDEKNLLQVIRKAGISLPTFCYHSELSIHGACRMCMVENEWGGLDAACSAVPKPGMVIKTNTKRLRRYRKNILELLLANHCRDCTTCQNNGSCKLQSLAERFGIEDVRFPNTAESPKLDTSSLCITRDTNKCILCGDCVRMCDEIQQVGAIDFIHRGSDMSIGCVFDKPIGESNCVGCGQCAAVCPTGSIVVKSDLAKVWNDLEDEGTKMIAQIAPAVRVAIGHEFGLAEGENAMGKIVAALRRMGFDEVYDTSTGADLTVIEESNELLARVGKNHDMPLFTSCCPAWVQYCEQNYPELMDHVSTCKSPMQMFASIIKDQYSDSERRLVQVAIMPCTAKKYEAARSEFVTDDTPDVDHVITTQELVRMINESGIVFDELDAEAVDSAFSVATGAGVIFGVTGGVTEAVLRRISTDKSSSTLLAIAYKGVRGLEGVKEVTVPYGENNLRIAIVSGLGNTAALIEQIKAGEHFDFVEVMACPGGCIAGAGQPYIQTVGQEKRAKGLYSVDKMSSIKYSEKNPLIMHLYDSVLKDREHELLHVNYQGQSTEK